ncbi:MAG TPA: metallophosphoesterase, partial [Candidatus Lokiarchaeia archaeon]|nr:metallophosphoesterase [Candidatus Lokiarchaeia archaeon]
LLKFSKVGLLVMTVICVPTFAGLSGIFQPPADAPLIALPGANPSSQVVIACYTAMPFGNLILAYSPAGFSAASSYAMDVGNGNEHRFLLAGLASNTSYWYQLSTNTTPTQSIPPDLTQVNYFKTTPTGSGQNFTFLSTSDIHDDMPADLARQMAVENADLIIEAGDFTNLGSSPLDWQQYFASSEIINEHTTSGVPAPLIVPAIGNHDGEFFGTNNYRQYFTGVGNGTGSSLWYRLDFGDIHFIVLDVEWGLETFPGAQEAWLRATLASINPQDWIIVITHCPIYSSGNNGNVPGMHETLEPILKASGVDLVISGHDHHYQRMIEDNITYMITACCHPDTEKGADIPGSQAYIVGQEMYGKYVINGNTLDIYGIYANGTVADSAIVTR